VQIRVSLTLTCICT